ncbi:hypothetical protein CsSME_00043153 [Camellia sinensis var. sinensis]
MASTSFKGKPNNYLHPFATKGELECMEAKVGLMLMGSISLLAPPSTEGSVDWLYFVGDIRRSLLNEDEYGFQRAKRPIYYDEGLEEMTL